MTSPHLIRVSLVLILDVDLTVGPVHGSVTEPEYEPKTPHPRVHVPLPVAPARPPEAAVMLQSPESVHAVTVPVTCRVAIPFAVPTVPLKAKSPVTMPLPVNGLTTMVRVSSTLLPLIVPVKSWYSEWMIVQVPSPFTNTSPRSSIGEIVPVTVVNEPTYAREWASIAPLRLTTTGGPRLAKT